MVSVAGEGYFCISNYFMLLGFKWTLIKLSSGVFFLLYHHRQIEIVLQLWGKIYIYSVERICTEATVVSLPCVTFSFCTNVV